jgi:hypothetical protein
VKSKKVLHCEGEARSNTDSRKSKVERSIIAKNRERSGTGRSNPEKTVTKNWIASLTLAMTVIFDFRLSQIYELCNDESSLSRQPPVFCIMAN